MSFTGILLTESLRTGASLNLPFTVSRLWVADAGDPGAGQPKRWTFIEFRVSEAAVDRLVADLSSALAAGPWYCDLRSHDETIVVFAGRSFRYPRGDRSARASAEAYARSVGVPEHQLDWPE